MWFPCFKAYFLEVTSHWRTFYKIHTGVPKMRTNYLLPYRGFLNVHEEKYGKNVLRQKNQLFLLLLLTVIQCKQRYIRTSLP
jgi:hypothetical protein